MKQNSVLVLIFALALSSMAFAGGDPNYVLNAGSAADAQGTSVNITVTMDSSAGLVQGWSWGLCTASPGVATVTAVVDGTTTATVKGGLAPDFNQKTLLAGGWTVGVVISFIGAATLPTGAGYSMNVATYSLDAAAPASTSLDFCDTLGSPPVATVIVVGGASIGPVTNSGSLTVLAVPQFFYIAPDATGSYDPISGAGSLSLDVSILDNAGVADNTQGFSMGLEHDGSILQTNSVVAAGPIDALGPDFFTASVAPTIGNGWTLGVVYAFTGGVFAQFQPAAPVATVTYSTVAGALAGNPGPVSSPLTWTNTLGTPPVANVVVVGGASIPADADNGSITLTGTPPDVAFSRGDCNGDGILNIADGIWILNDLFQSGPDGTCAEACDVNGDDSFDQSDAVYVFNQQFLFGPNPPAPFPGCGIEPGADCDSSACP